MFQSLSYRLPEREREREMRNDGRDENIKTTSPAPTASTVRPCPTCISHLVERLGIQIMYPGSLLDPTGRETLMYFIYMADRLFLQKRIVIHAETKGISHFSMPIFFQNFHCTVFKFIMIYEPGSSGG